jgi:hypothetical protein
MTNTEQVIASRLSASAAVKTGVWCSDYTKAKKYANENNVPILVVWSNGDKCGHCVNFNKCILDKTFTKWQKNSGVVFWIGYGDDPIEANRHGGKGYTFAKNGNLTNYPFVRLYWKSGGIDVAKAGDDWAGASGSGAATLVKNLKSYLKKYTPCSGDDCDDKPKSYKLTYKKNEEGGKYSLYVNGRCANDISGTAAKYIVERYNSCQD